MNLKNKKTFFGGLLVLLLFSAWGFYDLVSKTIPDSEAIREASDYNPEIAQTIQDNELEINYLYQFLGGYPPQFKSDEQETEVEKVWSETIKRTEVILLKAFSKEQVSVLHYQLGELYRFGHNLDNDGSWPKSEEHFKASILAEPNNYLAKVGLATLYVNTGSEFASDAEEMFLSALNDTSNIDEKVAIYQGLFFANYYLGKIDEAGIYLDKALEIDSENEDLLSLKRMLSVVQDRKSNSIDL